MMKQMFLLFIGFITILGCKKKEQPYISPGKKKYTSKMGGLRYWQGRYGEHAYAQDWTGNFSWQIVYGDAFDTFAIDVINDSVVLVKSDSFFYGLGNDSSSTVYCEFVGKYSGYFAYSYLRYFYEKDSILYRMSVSPNAYTYLESQ